jgi:hypothetical protein
MHFQRGGVVDIAVCLFSRLRHARSSPVGAIMSGADPSQKYARRISPLTKTREFPKPIRLDANSLESHS